MGNKALKVLVFIGYFSFQGIAQSIPIQLMVVDSDGFEKVNHAVKLRLTLTNDTSNTTGQYQEVHLTQSNDFGIVSESLGGGVVTTNSSVYALSEFAFNATEPMIKIELDTSVLSNQYYTVGTLAYTYPLVSRRALRSDSSDYSSLSFSSEFSDTAEFARNFNESLDYDTSATNELQNLTLVNDTLELSISNDKVYFPSKPNVPCVLGTETRIDMNGILPISQGYVITSFHDTLIMRGYYNSTFGYYQIIPSIGAISTIFTSTASITYEPTSSGLLIIDTGTGFVYNWFNKNNSIDTISTSINGLTQWSYPKVFIEDSSVLVIKQANVSGSYFLIDIAGKTVSTLTYRSIYDENEWSIIGVDSVLIGDEIWDFSFTTKKGDFPFLKNKEYWINPKTQLCVTKGYSLAGGFYIYNLVKGDSTYIGASYDDFQPVGIIDESLYLRRTSGSNKASLHNLELSQNEIARSIPNSSYSLYEKIGSGNTLTEFSKEIPNKLYITYFGGCFNNSWVQTEGSSYSIISIE